MQMLFQAEQSGSTADEVSKLFWQCHEASGQARSFAEQLFRSAVSRRSEVNAAISAAAKNWRLDRLASVDRSVVCVAIVEFLVVGTAKPIIINEAIEIARKYGTDKSPEFVNGLLDTILSRTDRSTS